MRTGILSGVGLILACWANGASAQEVIWRAVKTDPATSQVTLDRPQPLEEPTLVPPPPLPATPRVVRGQAGDIPPPPAFPGGGPAPYSTIPPGGNAYNGGVVNSDADLGGFWSRMGNNLKRCWGDVTGSVNGAFQTGPGGRQPFQSDHEFDYFTSPVSNPFFFEDPRSLTEVRPEFIWQHTPSNNSVFNGGNNFVLAGSASVAITPNISFLISRFGFESLNPNGTTTNIDLASRTSLMDIALGPKITFIRNETSKTVAAAGLTFDIPAGAQTAGQDTGHLSLIPYFSIAQNFGRNPYGSFNFMNTDGYTFRTDNTRTESFYSSFHIDFDIADAHRFYPLIELNWRNYTRSGGSRNIGFEGNDLDNFGSQHVSGLNELTLAFGGRIKINNYIQWGIALEFNTLPNSDGRHLDEFRLTTDFIFRY